MQSQRVAIGTFHIDVDQAGLSGRPVIMVHGIGVSGAYFSPLVDVMSKTNKVFVIDLPGYGNTPKPPTPLDIPQLAAVVDEFVDKYNLRWPVLVGQSMGCQIVAELAKTNARKYKEIILISPSVNRQERHRFMLAIRLLQDAFREPARLVLLVLNDYMRMGMRRYVTTVNFMINNHIDRSIREYRGRTLIVHGRKDKISPGAWCCDLAKIAQRGTCVEIADAAHLAQYTHPVVVNNACREFLESEQT